MGHQVSTGGALVLGTICNVEFDIKFKYFNDLLIDIPKSPKHAAPSPKISPVDFMAPKQVFYDFSREAYVLEKKRLEQKLFKIKFSTKYTHKSLAQAYSSISYGKQLLCRVFAKIDTGTQTSSLKT